MNFYCVNKNNSIIHLCEITKDKIIWDSNECKYYLPTISSIKKYISDYTNYIIDEHNNKYTLNELIKYNK